MDINRRKTGLGRLIEIAGIKRWLLIGAMSLAVITAIVQFVPIIAVYNILIELAKNAHRFAIERFSLNMMQKKYEEVYRNRQKK